MIINSRIMKKCKHCGMVVDGLTKHLWDAHPEVFKRKVMVEQRGNRERLEEAIIGMDADSAGALRGLIEVGIEEWPWKEVELEAFRRVLDGDARAKIWKVSGI